MNEVLTVADMTEADRLAVAAGVPSLTLMEHAGRAVADEAGKMVSPGGRVAVLAGPGNNGGDGFVAARYLRQRGFDVRMHLLGARDQLKGDAAAMARRWELPVRPANEDALQSMHLVIDALFGAGLSRPLDGDAAALVDAVNASGLRVLAVDVPSGLDGTTGMPVGPAVQATKTVTFFRKKPAHLLLPGRMLCGETIVVDIGIPEGVLAQIKPGLCENSPALWLVRFPWPKLDSHKYARGHAVVVSGPAHQTGASRLAAVAALRSGAGLVTLVGTPVATNINAAHMTSVMVHSLEGDRSLADFLSDKRRNAVLIGPGAFVGPETAENVLTVLSSHASVVLDADALTSFGHSDRTRDRADATSSGAAPMGFLRAAGSRGADASDLFRAVRERAPEVVMTPHDGEFARLFGALGGTKLDRARRAAEVSGAVLVLKGADTVIAAPGGCAVINSNAPPWLATAGSGDVLAGIITGLLAQGMPAFDAACAGVWLHGAAASSHGPGLISDDLAPALPRAIADLARLAKR